MLFTSLSVFGDVYKFINNFALIPNDIFLNFRDFAPEVTSKGDFHPVLQRSPVKLAQR